MPVPLKEFVRQVLLETDRAARMHRAIHAAWAAACERHPERGRWRRKSTFRGIVWEEAIRELAKIAADDADFRLVEHRDTASVIVEDAVLFRVKHADATLATANYPTTEATNFDNHEVDLYGYVGLQRVELCYVLDEFENRIIWVGVAARKQGRHLWKIELTDKGIMVPIELPLEDEPEHDTARLARIKKPEQGHDEKKKDRDG